MKRILQRFKYVYLAIFLTTTCSEPEDHTRSDVSLSDITQSDTNTDTDTNPNASDTNPDADTNPNLDCNPDTSTDPCYCDIRIYSQWYNCCPSLDSVDIYYICADDGVEDDYGRWVYESNEGPICPAPDFPTCPWLKDN